MFAEILRTFPQWEILVGFEIQQSALSNQHSASSSPRKERHTPEVLNAECWVLSAVFE